LRAVDELGYANATVSDITARARVSRRTFYELFANREECLASVLDLAVESIRVQVARAGLDGLSWRERVRGGLWEILCCLDRDPALARFCVVQSARGSQAVLERRERIVKDLAAIVDEGRLEGAGERDCPPLSAEGVVGAAIWIVYARLLHGESGPLTGLFSELMGMIVLPYLGASAARRERARALPSVPVTDAHASSIEAGDLNVDALEGISMRFTYRTMCVLEAVAEHPGLSNRQVGEHAGIPDQGQASKLLARLGRLGLLENTGEGHAKGEPNRWSLTEQGRQVTRTIRTHAGMGAHAHTNGGSV
jgi:AcrR family transcriptional regulator/DNA-binding MarR family transcriptional regulator